MKISGNQLYFPMRVNIIFLAQMGIKKCGESEHCAWSKKYACYSKHDGGSVMVWGCMAESGVENVVIIEGTMDKTVYLKILKTNCIKVQLKWD